MPIRHCAERAYVGLAAAGWMGWRTPPDNRVGRSEGADLSLRRYFKYMSTPPAVHVSFPARSHSCRVTATKPSAELADRYPQSLVIATAHAYVLRRRHTRRVISHTSQKISTRCVCQNLTRTVAQEFRRCRSAASWIGSAYRRRLCR